MQAHTNMQSKLTETQGWPLVSWWMRITSPNPNSPEGRRHPRWREEVTSLLIPLAMLIVLLGISTSFNDPARLAILSLAFCLDVVALFLKRLGMLRITGAIVTLTIELGLLSAVIAAGPEIEHLSLLDHLLQAVIVAMAFFSPISGFFVAFLNCIFIFSILKFLPHSGDLDHHLSEDFWTIFIPPILLHLFITVVFFIIMGALIREIKRADSAEELARLKQLELELREQEMRRSQQLEVGTQVILQTLNTTATHADFSVRVPLAQDNILWRVAYSINNLLARLQGFRQERAELDKTRAVINQLMECMRRGQHFPLNQWTGTMVDPLIVEFHNYLKMVAKPSD